MLKDIVSGAGKSSSTLVFPALEAANGILEKFREIKERTTHTHMYITHNKSAKDINAYYIHHANDTVAWTYAKTHIRTHVA